MHWPGHNSTLTMTEETVNLKKDQQKSPSLNNREKKDFKIWFHNLWDNVKRTNTHLIVVPERMEEKKKTPKHMKE